MNSITIDRMLTYIGMLWFGVMAGFFWAFSVVVMPGLDDTDQLAAMSAMQAINDGVQNALFAIGFFGAPLICLALAGQAVIHRRGVASLLMLVASVTYLIGVFVVTVAFNVPLNDELATYDPAAATNAQIMTDYIEEWTLWNHVRTVAGILALALLGASLFMNRSDVTTNGTSA